MCTVKERRTLSKVQITRIKQYSKHNKYEVKLGDGRLTTFRHDSGKDLFVCVKKALEALIKENLLSTRRIPPEEFKEDVDSSIPYITFEMIEKYHTKEEVERFRKFMTGQTVTGVGKDNECGIFVCDYERWINEGMKSQQGFNWD